MLGRFHDALLLAPMDACRGTAEFLMFAQPHLDEYEAGAILHDQIDLAHSAAKVARYPLESRDFKIALRKALRHMPGRVHSALFL